jgi:NitT/TauT family transport system substrate-binding protein
MSKFSAFFRSFLIALVALGFVVACSQTPNTDVSKLPPLNSSVISWIGYGGFYKAIDAKFFSEAGLNVKEQFFQSSSDQFAPFLSGQTDLAWVASGDAVQLIAKDPSAKIIYLVDYSNGSDGILGRNIKSPQDAEGKTVARENLLFVKVLLRAFLQKGGLTEKDVVIKNMAGSDAASAFGAKHVDLAVTFEPFLGNAAKKGKGEVVFTTKDTNLIADVIVARESLLQSRKADLQAYLKAVDRAVKLVNGKEPEAIRAIAKKLGVKTEEVTEQLGGVTLFDLEGNKTIAFDKNNSKSLIGNLELTSKAAYDFKMVPEPLKVESLYDDSIVKSM